MPPNEKAIVVTRPITKNGEGSRIKLTAKSETDDQAPDEPSRTVINAVFEAQDVHIKGGLVKPMGIEIAAAKRERSLDKVRFVFVIGVGKIVPHSPQTQCGRQH